MVHPVLDIPSANVAEGLHPDRASSQHTDIGSALMTRPPPPLSETDRNRTGLSDEEIFARIHKAVARQQLPPGTRLREDEIRKIFNVSRARIRTVFSRLAFAGVVTLEPNRGASIARPTVQEARDLFVARRTFEGTIVRAAAERMTRKQALQLRAHIALEVEAEQRRDRAEMIRLSGEFHLLLAEIAGNSVLLKFLTELVTRESLVIAAYETPGRSSCSNHEHSRILDALVAKDADAACALMLEHLHEIENRLDLDRNEIGSIDLAAVLG
jgi:DNA-binding GntR family transcriptional regulator